MEEMKVMAFVQDQPWEKPMSAEEALMQGTAFGSLVKPFEGDGGAR